MFLSLSDLLFSFSLMYSILLNLLLLLLLSTFDPYPFSEVYEHFVDTHLSESEFFESVTISLELKLLPLEGFFDCCEVSESFVEVSFDNNEESVS